MKSTCVQCQTVFEYDAAPPVLGININEFKPSICSIQCESHLRQERQREVSKNLFYRIMGVMPEAYKGVKMSDFNEMTLTNVFSQSIYLGADELIKKYCSAEYWNITLISETYGNGKTRLGLYILACLAFKGIYKTSEITNIQDAGYYSAIDIVKLLRTESFDSKQYYLKKFYNCRALMIDDLGQEPQTSSVEIAGILKVREERKRKTIITSNLGSEEFDKRYTGRIYSRLAKGSFYVKGIDRRTENK